MAKKELIVGDQLDRIKDEFREELESTIGKKNLNDFRQFAFKDNMLQMAIAFMLGAAFKKVVSGIADYIVMPFINYVIGHTGAGWREIAWTPTEGLTFEVGQCASVFVDFILMAIILFVMWKKTIEPFIAGKPKKKPIECMETIQCPKCYSDIHYKCERCPQCTSWIKE